MLPEFADSSPLFPAERAQESLRILSKGLQLGRAQLRPLSGNPPVWEARLPGFGSYGRSDVEAARRLLQNVVHSREIGLADDALDAISEAYALVGNFDRSNWQTGEVAPC